MPNNFLVLDKDGQKARIRFTGSSADNVAIVDADMPDSIHVLQQVRFPKIDGTKLVHRLLYDVVTYKITTESEDKLYVYQKSKINP